MSVTVFTTLGSLKIELFADISPVACFNFLALCAEGAYINSIFHRCVPGFIIQGGDTESVSGRTGSSIVRKSFTPSPTQTLSHDSRGVIALVLDENKQAGSQFYITLAALLDLDSSSIIGHLIDGDNTLQEFERLEIDTDYRPLQPPKVTRIVVHANPFATGDIEIPKFI
ncbi:hypothetical protein GEMRC1_002974 [Eukaryota sp. GEM-RC1]